MSAHPGDDGFIGFPPGTPRFLADLATNNNREWFEAHRPDYGRLWLAPALSFASAAGARIRGIRPGVTVDPRVNGNVFRINRDVRFHRDKAPYKDHLDFWFWEGDKKTAISGFFFRLTATEAIAGAGSHAFVGPALAGFRAAVASNAADAELVEVMDALSRAGMRLPSPELRRTPTGFGGLGAARDDLLRNTSLWATATRPVGAWISGPEVVDWAAEAWAGQAPLHAWIMDHVAPGAPSRTAPGKPRRRLT